MSPREAINRLKGIARRVSPVAEFYAERRQAWHELAVTCAQNTLLALAPPEVAPDEWARSVENAVSRISATLITAVTQDGGQMLMSQGQTGGINLALSKGSEVPAAQQAGPVSMEDLLRFIRAGREGHPDGKRIEYLMDGSKSDLQVAWRMIWSMRSGKGGASRIADHVAKFTGSQHASAIEQLYPQVLIAWVAVFLPRARRELKAWVRRRVRQS